MRLFNILLLPIFMIACNQSIVNPVDISNLVTYATNLSKLEIHLQESPVEQKPTAVPKKPSTPAKPKQPTKTTPQHKTKQPSSASESNILAIEREVVRLVNIERTKRGLKPLNIDSKLSMVARKKSDDMKTKNYFDHQSPTYGSPFDMMNHFGVHYRTAGENIAAGQRTAKEVMNGWMNSQGHRENILNPSFTHIGVGYVSGGSYGTYWTQEFTG